MGVFERKSMGQGRLFGVGAAIALGVTSLVAVDAGPAAAHNPDDCTIGYEVCEIETIWLVDSVQFTFTPSFPPNSPYPLRSRVQDGILNWPISSTGRPSYYFSSGSANRAFTCADTYALNENYISYGAIDGSNGVLALTCRDIDYGFIANSQMLFDSGETYWPYDSAPPSSHLDMESVATHELGHTLGWRGHFSSSDVICPSGGWGSTAATMCPTYTYGLDHFRSTSTHDRHTVAAKY